MQIDLRQVLEAPFRWQETQRIAAAVLNRPEIVELGEVTWHGVVESERPAFLLRAELAYEQTLVCTRCLERIVQPVGTAVELRVLVAPAAPPAGEHELREEDVNVLVIPDETLDLDPILLEQLQLNIPMRALCSPECQGLCPVCGGNRNEAPCDCRQQDVDPRWAALAALRGDDGGKR